MHAIAQASRRTKSAFGAALAAVPTDLPSLGAPWLVNGLASLYGRSRLADRLPQVANVVVSNVPGSAVPLYFAGARARSHYPVSIASHGFALNITVHSFDGQFDVGLTACRRAVPDLGDLADRLVKEYQLLRDLSPPAARAKPASSPPAPKRRTRQASAVHA